jgi:hypothetical protein
MQTPSGRESSEAWVAQLRELAPRRGELDAPAVFYRAGYAAGRAESGRVTMPWWGVLTAACLAGLAIGLAGYRAGYDRGLAIADGGSEPRHAKDMIVERTVDTKVAVDDSGADERPASSASADGSENPGVRSDAANVKSPSILAASERDRGAWAWTDWLGLLRSRDESVAGGRDATTLTAFHAWTTDNVGPWSLASLEARLVEARSLEDRPDRSPQHRDSRPAADPARTPRQTLRAGDVGRWTELANQGWINEER